MCVLHLLTLIEELSGRPWSRTERERRLFPLCVQVQAALRRRHGEAYTTPDVSQVPEDYVDEAKEVLNRALFPEIG